jgi:anti-sigma-K factor RskA
LRTQHDISNEHLTDYVFGLCDQEETLAIEQELEKNAGLQEEIDKIYASLATYAEDSCPELPSHLKGEIKSQLNFNTESSSDNSPQTRVKASDARVKDGNTWKWYAVAASVALMLSLTYNIMLGDELNNAKQTIAGLEQNATEMAQQGEILRTNYKQIATNLTFVRHEKTKMVRMMGTDYMPNAMVTVIWNQQTKEVMVDLNHMEEPPKDHQHQLWALVDGKPIDLGVFDISNAGEMVKMKSTGKADEFAVTIEVTGGSSSPTLERLCVHGKI